MAVIQWLRHVADHRQRWMTRHSSIEIAPLAFERVAGAPAKERVRVMEN